MGGADGTAMARVLRDPVAGRYLAGVVVSGFGTSALWLTAGIWVKSLTGSDSLAALTVCAMWAPVLGGPALGALADRLDRTALLVRVNLAMACLLAALLLVDSGRTVWLVFVVLVLYGAGGVLLDAAESALVAGTVPASLLADFNGLRMTANEGVKLVAPLAGAGLYARFGGPAVALLNGGDVRAGRPAVRPAAGTGGPARPEPDGAVARRTRRRPAADPRLGRAAPTGHGGLGHDAARRGERGRDLRVRRRCARPRTGVRGRAVRRAGRGFRGGGAAGGAAAAPLPERAFAAGGIAVFGSAVAARAVPLDTVALAASAAIGFGLPCVLIAAATAVQRETPDAVLGRTAATAGSLMTAPNAVALALGAGLVAVADVRVLAVAAGTSAVLAAGVLAAGGRGLRGLRGQP